MSLFQILFGSQISKGFCPTNPDGTGVLGLEMDAVVSESPEFKATPTKSPVERGAKITDHVSLEPRTLSVEAVVTSTPAVPFGSPRGLISPNAPADAHEYLKTLWETREPFTFVGGFEVYENMVLTSYTPMRSSKTGNDLEFRATMEQITIVSSEVVPATSFKDPGQGAQSSSSRGVQPTSEAPLSLSNSTGSALSQMYPDLWR